MPQSCPKIGLQARFIFVSLPTVKPILLILSLLLSLLSGGKVEKTAISAEAENKHFVSETSSNERTPDYSRERECCITAVQGYAFSGNESSNSVSIRTPQSGRRSSSQMKSSFRIIKSGKVIDNKILHPFLALSYQQLSGLIFSERYLFIICRLRF